MYIRWFVSLGKWSDFPDNMQVLPFSMTANWSVQHCVITYCKKYIHKVGKSTHDCWVKTKKCKSCT